MKTKRNLIQIWLLCAATLPAAVQAQFNYTVTTNGTITITGYTGSDGAVDIPYKYNGLTVTGIGDWAFYSKNILTSVTIPDGVTGIGYEAFTYCRNLASVTLGTNLTSIGVFAFGSCDKMTNFTMPDTVTNVGMSAFGACNALPSVTIPKNLISIGNFAFGGCTGMSAITVDTNNPAYSSLNGVLFNKAKTSLIQCPGGKAGSYSVPNAVANIGMLAFETCANLISVTVPSSVASIRDGAFNGCTSLNEVYFLGNAPTPGSGLFDNGSVPTVYYLSGKLGWLATYGGRPTALWTPRVDIGDGSIGVLTNQFGFNITWASGMTVVVEACTNLANAIWFPLQTNTLTGDSYYFSDPQWTNCPGRFYRLRSP